MVSMPCGITNAIMTNVGAILIMKLATKIKFFSHHKKIHCTVISIFIMSYINQGILPMYRLQGREWMPKDFTNLWVEFYSSMIKTSMILSNLMPYIGILIKIAVKRCCCCCKRKSYKPNTHLNPEFPLERRYASLLTLVMISLTYGVCIPGLFIVASGILITQMIIDKLLITYFYKERVEHNDLLNRSALRIMKYSLGAFLLFGGEAIA